MVVQPGHNGTAPGLDNSFAGLGGEPRRDSGDLRTNYAEVATIAVKIRITKQQNLPRTF